MLFTLDALEVLDAIDRHKGFSGAAAELHRAQSAVSYSVKQLEEGLGLQLFDRSGHRAVLTAAGRAVLDEGRGLLTHARRIESLASKLHETWEARLEVVVDGILPIDPVLSALRRMADDAVPTHIQIRVEFLGGVQDRFERDRADLMLVKDYLRSDALVEHPLAEVEVVLVASRSHALAAAASGSGPASVSLAELQRHVELTVHDSSESQRLGDTRIFGGPRVFYLSDFAMKLRAIELGLGFGWMPLYLVRDALHAGALVVVPYEGGARYAFQPVLVHPRERPLGRAGQTFLARLKEAAASR
ncbi:MAG TPA: LysR family transcriptional regulator [Polyangiaceae bacterium]|nr:LysR family transcriptional regulator [Polyangiaceae bacterium]